MTESTPRADHLKALKQWIIRVVTAGVSVGILWYYLRDVDWEALKAAAGRADLSLAIAGIIIPMIGFWASDCAFTVRSFKWFHSPVGFWNYFIIKAAGYLLAMVNITFATGGVFLYFMSKTGIGVKKQTGLLAFRLCMSVFGFTTFLALLTLAAVAARPEEAAALKLQLIGPAIGLIILVMLEMAAFFIYRRGLILRRLPGKWFEGEFWQPLRESKLRHWAEGFAWTAPFIVLYFIGMYLVARAFHVQVPFFYFFLRMPIAALISGLPVAFGGFGTTTAAWDVFFRRFTTPADIAAITIFIPAVRLFFRLGLGAAFMPLALRELEGLKMVPWRKRGDSEKEC